MAHPTEKDIRSALNALEKAVPELTERPLSIAQVASACLPGCINYRKPIDEDWCDGGSQLAAWYAEFSKRESMMATVPREPDGGRS